jgi:putative flippase GtrA
VSTGRLAGEAARFWVVGGCAYAADLLVFNVLLLQVQVHSVPAKVASGVVAVAVAYSGSRWWTWRDRRSPEVAGELVRFVAVSVVAAGLQVLCLVLAREVLGLRSPVADNVSANVVGMAVATVFRFWAFRTVVFRGRGRVTAADGGTRVREGGAPPS